MRYWIYESPDRMFPYTVMEGREWPNGQVVGIAATKWGAARIVRKHTAKSKRPAYRLVAHIDTEAPEA